MKTSPGGTPKTTNGVVHIIGPLGGTSLLLTPKQAAEALAISPRKLWGMTASDEIPHVKIGRCVRYPVNDLRAWVAERKQGGASS